ncbi:MAG: hypothetical protein P1V97_11265 [Planctomycetota bacterium]|nr:hypothetical protein [Planctomycetota bacterium]
MSIRLFILVIALSLSGCVWNEVNVERQTLFDISQRSSPSLLKVSRDKGKLDLNPQWSEACKITKTKKETVSMTMLVLTFSEGFWPMVFPVDLVFLVTTGPYALVQRPFLDDSYQESVKVVKRGENLPVEAALKDKVFTLKFPDGRNIRVPIVKDRAYISALDWCDAALDPLLLGGVPTLRMSGKVNNQSYTFENTMEADALAELTMKLLFDLYRLNSSGVEAWVKKIQAAPKKGPVVAWLKARVGGRLLEAKRQREYMRKKRALEHARWKEERRLRVKNMPRLSSGNPAAARALASLPMKDLYDGVNSRVVNERAFNLHFAMIDGVKILVMPIKHLPKSALVFERGAWKFPGSRWDSRLTELPAVSTRSICAQIKSCRTCGGGGSVASGRYIIRTSSGTSRKDVTYRDSSGRTRTEFGALVETRTTTSKETQTSCKSCKGTGIQGFRR